jgi:hypothetical protein
MAAQRGLGRLFDIGTDFVPVDLNTAGATGKRLALSNATGVTFVIALAASGGTEDIVITVKQHTASVSGTSNNLASATVTGSSGITAYWVKSEATLDNDESWVEVAQAEAATVTLAGTTYGALQVIAAIYVGADQLADGYGWVSLDIADPGSTARLGACLSIVHDLAAQRKPANLGNLLKPGAANV